MKNKLISLAAVLMFVAVIGKFYAPPVMAQVRAALMQDVDQPARAPFQATVQLNLANPIASFTIPAGKRLVVDYISLNGAAQTAGPNLQPVVLFTSSVAGNPNATYYIAPEQSASDPGQYYHTEKPTIYADSLSVGIGYAGYSPTFMVFGAVVSGHLINP